MASMTGTDVVTYSRERPGTSGFVPEDDAWRSPISLRGRMAMFRSPSLRWALPANRLSLHVRARLERGVQVMLFLGRQLQRYYDSSAFRFAVNLSSRCAIADSGAQ